MSHAVRRHAAAWLFVVTFGPFVRPGLANPGPHIRVFDDSVAAQISLGVDSSATFRSLVTRLETSPVLIFVRCQPHHQPGRSAAGLTFLTSAGGYRYLRIFVRCDLPPVVQLPLLAHEFRHALEVAASTDVVDQETMRRHYEQIGYLSNTDDRHPSFETTAAIETQRQVTVELAARQRPHVMTAAASGAVAVTSPTALDDFAGPLGAPPGRTEKTGSTRRNKETDTNEKGKDNSRNPVRPRSPVPPL